MYFETHFLENPSPLKVTHFALSYSVEVSTSLDPPLKTLFFSRGACFLFFCSSLDQLSPALNLTLICGGSLTHCVLYTKILFHLFSLFTFPPISFSVFHCFFFFPNSALGLYFEARSLSLGVSSHFNDTCFHWHKPFRELRKICALVFRLCGACCLGGDEKDRIEF